MSDNTMDNTMDTSSGPPAVRRPVAKMKGRLKNGTQPDIKCPQPVPNLLPPAALNMAGCPRPEFIKLPAEEPAEDDWPEDDSRDPIQVNEQQATATAPAAGTPDHMIDPRLLALSSGAELNEVNDQQATATAPAAGTPLDSTDPQLLALSPGAELNEVKEQQATATAPAASRPPHLQPLAPLPSAELMQVVQEARAFDVRVNQLCGLMANDFDEEFVNITDADVRTYLQQEQAKGRNPLDASQFKIDNLQRLSMIPGPNQGHYGNLICLKEFHEWCCQNHKPVKTTSFHLPEPAKVTYMDDEPAPRLFIPASLANRDQMPLDEKVKLLWDLVSKDRNFPDITEEDVRSYVEQEQAKGNKILEVYQSLIDEFRRDLEIAGASDEDYTNIIYKDNFHTWCTENDKPVKTTSVDLPKPKPAPLKKKKKKAPSGSVTCPQPAYLPEMAHVRMVDVPEPQVQSANEDQSFKQLWDLVLKDKTLKSINKSDVRTYLLQKAQMGTNPLEVSNEKVAEYRRVHGRNLPGANNDTVRDLVRKKEFEAWADENGLFNTSRRKPAASQPQSVAVSQGTPAAPPQVPAPTSSSQPLEARVKQLWDLYSIDRDGHPAATETLVRRFIVEKQGIGMNPLEVTAEDIAVQRSFNEAPMSTPSTQLANEIRRDRLGYWLSGEEMDYYGVFAKEAARLHALMIAPQPTPVISPPTPANAPQSAPDAGKPLEKPSAPLQVAGNKHDCERRERDRQEEERVARARAHVNEAYEAQQSHGQTDVQMDGVLQTHVQPTPVISPPTPAHPPKSAPDAGKALEKPSATLQVAGNDQNDVPMDGVFQTHVQATPFYQHLTVKPVATPAAPHQILGNLQVDVDDMDVENLPPGLPSIAAPPEVDMIEAEPASQDAPMPDSASAQCPPAFPQETAPPEEDTQMENSNDEVDLETAILEGLVEAGILQSTDDVDMDEEYEGSDVEMYESESEVEIIIDSPTTTPVAKPAPNGVFGQPSVNIATPAGSFVIPGLGLGTNKYPVSGGLFGGKASVSTPPTGSGPVPATPVSVAQPSPAETSSNVPLRKMAVPRRLQNSRNTPTVKHAASHQGSVPQIPLPPLSETPIIGIQPAEPQEKEAILPPAVLEPAVKKTPDTPAPAETVVVESSANTTSESSESSQELEQAGTVKDQDDAAEPVQPEKPKEPTEPAHPQAPGAAPEKKKVVLPATIVETVAEKEVSSPALHEAPPKAPAAVPAKKAPSRIGLSFGPPLPPPTFSYVPKKENSAPKSSIKETKEKEEVPPPAPAAQPENEVVGPSMTLPLRPKKAVILPKSPTEQSEKPDEVLPEPVTELDPGEEDAPCEEWPDTEGPPEQKDQSPLQEPAVEQEKTVHEAPASPPREIHTGFQDFRSDESSSVNDDSASSDSADSDNENVEEPHGESSVSDSEIDELSDSFEKLRVRPAKKVTVKAVVDEKLKKPDESLPSSSPLPPQDPVEPIDEEEPAINEPLPPSGPSPPLPLQDPAEPIVEEEPVTNTQATSETPVDGTNKASTQEEPSSEHEAVEAIVDEKLKKPDEPLPPSPPLPPQDPAEPIVEEEPVTNTQATGEAPVDGTNKANTKDEPSSEHEADIQATVNEEPATPEDSDPEQSDSDTETLVDEPFDKLYAELVSLTKRYGSKDSKVRKEAAAKPTMPATKVSSPLSIADAPVGLGSTTTTTKTPEPSAAPPTTAPAPSLPVIDVDAIKAAIKADLLKEMAESQKAANEEMQGKFDQKIQQLVSAQAVKDAASETAAKALKEQVTTLKEQVTTLESESKEQKAEIQDLKTINAALQQRVGDLEAGLPGFDDENDDNGDNGGAGEDDSPSDDDDDAGGDDDNGAPGEPEDHPSVDEDSDGDYSTDIDDDEDPENWAPERKENNKTFAARWSSGPSDATPEPQQDTPPSTPPHAQSGPHMSVVAPKMGFSIKGAAPPPPKPVDAAEQATSLPSTGPLATENLPEDQQDQSPADKPLSNSATGSLLSQSNNAPPSTSMFDLKPTTTSGFVFGQVKEGAWEDTDSDDDVAPENWAPERKENNNSFFSRMSFGPSAATPEPQQKPQAKSKARNGNSRKTVKKSKNSSAPVGAPKVEFSIKGAHQKHS